MSARRQRGPAQPPRTERLTTNLRLTPHFQREPICGAAPRPMRAVRGEPSASRASSPTQRATPRHSPCKACWDSSAGRAVCVPQGHTAGGPGRGYPAMRKTRMGEARALVCGRELVISPRRGKATGEPVSAELPAISSSGDLNGAVPPHPQGSQRRGRGWLVPANIPKFGQRH